MSGLSNSALMRKHLGDRPGASFTVAILMLVLSVVAVMAPLGLTAIGDAAMRDRVGQLSPLTRDAIAAGRGTPQVSMFGSAGADQMVPWTRFFEALDDVREAQPKELRALLGEPSALTQFGPLQVLSERFPPPLANWTFAPGLLEQVDVIDGEAPLAAPRDFVDQVNSPGRDWTEWFTTEPIDVMLSAASAAELDFAVGDEFTVLVKDARLHVPLKLAGIFEAKNPADDFWQHVPSVLKPSIFFTSESERLPTVAAVFDPGSLSSLGWLLSQSATTGAWYPLDVDAIDTQNASLLLAQLRAFAAASQPVGKSTEGNFGIEELRFTSDAPSAIEIAIAETRAIVAVVAVAGSGPLGVAIAVLLLGCRMLVEQRRSALRLLAARGAKASQLRGLLAIQGLLVGFVPVVVGAALGAALFIALGARTAITWPVFVLPAIMAFAPSAMLAIGGFRGLAFKGRTDMDASATPVARRLRIILEAVTVGLAVVASVLLLSRGIEAGEGEIAFDPLLAAAPLLLSLVACIIALRLYPFPLRALLRRFRRSPGFIGFLGAARALREPAAGLAPVLALIVGLSVAVSSGVLLSTVQQGVVTSAGMQVGADLKLDAARFTPEQLDAIADTDGVRAIATIAEQRAIELRVDGKRRLVSGFIVDPAALAEVQPPAYRLIPSGVSLAVSGDTVPTLVSPDAARIWASSDAITSDDFTIDPVGDVATATPLGARSNWMLISTEAAELLFAPMPPARTVLVALSDGADAKAVAASLRDTLADTAAGAAVRVSTPDSVVADISQGPAAAGLRAALLLCIILVALLSAVAVVMTLVLGTRARERLLALLPSLGANRRSGTALAAWEIWPAAAAAVIVGSIFGAALPLLVLAAVDLRPFTGSPVQPAYVADPLVLTAAVGGFLLLTALLTLGALTISRRARAASVLRTVEEA